MVRLILSVKLNPTGQSLCDSFIDLIEVSGWWTVGMVIACDRPEILWMDLGGIRYGSPPRDWPGVSKNLARAHFARKQLIIYHYWTKVVVRVCWFYIAQTRCLDPGNNHVYLSIWYMSHIVLYTSLPFGGCRCDTCFFSFPATSFYELSLDSTKAAHFTSQNTLITG